jgi:endonuclease/exonuclease/phosphatase family metal-dependent hydrolase
MKSVYKNIQNNSPSLQACREGCQFTIKSGIDGVGKYIMSVILYLFITMLVSCSPAIQYQPPVNDPLIFTPDEDNQFSILTYNIQTIFGKNEGKLNVLMDYLNAQQYDFVLLQELFDESVRNQIISSIDKNVYKSLVSRVDYDSFPENIFQDAGLFLISRYPQINLSDINFDDQVSVSEGAVHMKLHTEISLSTDFLANKSVMGSLHQLNDSTQLFIFTTHVQALGSRSHKREQYRQIRDFIEYATYAVIKTGKVKSSENLIVILTGDFNSNAYADKQVASLIRDLGSPRDLHQELNSPDEEYTMMVKLFNLYARFDYIFAYDKLGDYSFKKVSTQSINATDVKNDKDGSISDHLALKAVLKFEEPEMDSAQSVNLERNAK